MARGSEKSVRWEGLDDDEEAQGGIKVRRPNRCLRACIYAKAITRVSMNRYHCSMS
jgi:hypothetical protein